LRAVLAHVQEHVCKRVPHLARGPQDPQVVAVAQHGASASHDAIHDPREPRAKRIHSAAQLHRVRGLDQEVRVIRLDRVLDDAEVAPGAQRPERALELRDQAPAPQRRYSVANLQGDERRMRRRDSFAAAVPNPRPRSRRSTRSASTSAAGRQPKLELEIGHRHTHL
jgi:hypothetical protein